MQAADVPSTVSRLEHRNYRTRYLWTLTVVNGSVNMTIENIFDDDEFVVKAEIGGSQTALAKVNTATFTFHFGNKVFADKTVEGEATGFPKAATCDFKPEKVPDNLDYYEVTYEVEVTPAGKTPLKRKGSETIRVWPKTIKVIFTSDDGKAHKGVAFRVESTGNSKGSRPHTSKDDGTWEGTVYSFGTYAIEVDSPWEKTDVKAQGRVREYQVKKKSYTAKFLSPDPDDPKALIKQYVNLPETDPWDKTNPSGHILKIKVGVSDEELAKEGDIIFIECIFESHPDIKRTSPKKRLSGDNMEPNTCQEVDPEKKFEGQVKLEADKTAWFKVYLGISGGDECTVKIGTAKDQEDASLKFQNWRKVRP